MIVTDDDWNVSLNALGAPVYREAWVTYAYEDSSLKGRCFFAALAIRQDAQGGGKYGKTYINGTSPGRTELLCSNVNK